MRLLLFVLPFLVISNVYAQTAVVEQLCELPSEILETSGLENGPNDWFWTHNDSGNPAELYCIDTLGVVQRVVSVVGDSNTDWEDLTKDNEGNLYIGNFGNNNLNRPDLRIVKIPSIDTCTSTAIVSDTILFTYPDQDEFPPSGSYGNFDMEAFFWFEDSLHLFSKDRSTPSTGYSKHYRLPAVNGTYVAELVDSIYTGSSNFLTAITAADISENGDTVVLLNADHIWLISDFVGTDFSAGNVSELALGSFTQKEAVVFRNDFLYVTDEQEPFFNTGGNLYRVHPEVFMGVSESNNQIDYQPVYDQQQRLIEIRLSNAEKIKWKLLNLDGRLMQEGENVEKILAPDFTITNGVYVIQLFGNSGSSAMLIKL